MDDEVDVLSKQTHKLWMDPSTAISMVEGKIVGVSIDALISHMVAMGLAEKEERMDTTN
ncbi:hypothetical protein DPSP01_001928 [Paraphaeosphaeria sporulosa]